jgi:AcrR family transcriptional regulator
MARQVRSEATRRKILDAAIDVFSEVGYAAASWGTIIERTGMTKGALYHHFDSKESLASAIIEEGTDTLLLAFRNVSGPSSPALENLIHATFVVAQLSRSDKMVRAAEQLTVALSGFNQATSRVYTNWLAVTTDEARKAAREGDIREELTAETVAESIVSATFGIRLLADAITGDDLIQRLSRMWVVLLPAIAAEGSLPYFREFLAREALRQDQTSSAN